MDELRYAGILHPLQIPHHSLSSNPKDLKEGDIREGAIIFHKGKKFVDIGIGHLIPYYGKEHDKKRITVQIKSVLPISIKEVPDGVIEQYWGYKVKERPNLIKLLDEWNGEIILTSKKAKYATRQKLEEFLKDKRQLLLVFGAPDRGLYDVLGKKINQIPNSAILNFFPVQSTATIRMEEALLGILSVLNFENVN
jgi:predicted SPOUT superfamily RNA methylase MTH1